MNEETRPLLQRTTNYYFSERLTNGKVPSDLQVARPVYRQEDLHEASSYVKPSTSLKKTIGQKFKSFSCYSICANTFPILHWLPRYNWKKDIMADIISGMTVAVMHIPQGMGYSMLGNVHPIVGIYMAFFPVLIYFFLGTSRHISIGTFAVICLMTGQVVSTYATGTFSADVSTNHTHNIGNPELPPGQTYSAIEVATTVTFVVAIIQFFMYVLHLGVFSNLLSETLVNGFTSGAACHVLSSQLKDLFGLNIVKHRGKFSIVYTVYDAILALPQANKTAVSISMVAVVTMVINNEIFKPWLAKKTKVPFPIELMAVVIGTASSFFFNFHERYDINIVGDIPTGLPAPALPRFELIPYVALDSLIITIVSYTITISMALIFAQKAHYEVSANQELLAMSGANLFGSFFSTMPISASLARSMVQFNVGGVTQITSIVSCSLLLIVLLWVGPVFESLPRAILSSIIVVALKAMLMQIANLKKYWRLSKWDATVWIVCFLTTVIISIDIGLLAGIVVSLISIFVQGYRPYTCLLGVVPNTDLYLDCKRYKGVSEIPGIKIFHYSGALNFASKSMYKDHLYKKVCLDPSAVLTRRAESKGDYANENEELLLKCIILDFSAITYIDPVGVQLLRNMANEYSQLDVAMYVANCSGPIYETLEKYDKFEGEKSKLTIYPTIHDAVLYAKMNEL